MTEIDMEENDKTLATLITDTLGAIPFNKNLGLHLEQVEIDHVILRFDMKPELIGNYLHGILHGGVISAVLDMAGGTIVLADAIHHQLDKSLKEIVAIIGKTSTVDLQIQYLRPGLGKYFFAHAFLTKSGKKLSFARMELHNEENVLIATGNATYLRN